MTQRNDGIQLRSSYLPVSVDLVDLLRRLEKAAPNRQPKDKIARVSECRGTMQHACVDLHLPRKSGGFNHVHNSRLPPGRLCFIFCGP